MLPTRARHPARPSTRLLASGASYPPPPHPTRPQVRYYREAWSQGKIRILDEIMAEDHEQHDE